MLWLQYLLALLCLHNTVGTRLSVDAIAGTTISRENDRWSQQQAGAKCGSKSISNATRHIEDFAEHPASMTDVGAKGLPGKSDEQPPWLFLAILVICLTCSSIMQCIAARHSDAQEFTRPKSTGVTNRQSMHRYTLRRCSIGQAFASQEDEFEVEQTSFVWSVESEKEMSPWTKEFWSSYGGKVVQLLTIVLFMHLDAGVPILYQLWRIRYGGEHQEVKFSFHSVVLTSIALEIVSLTIMAIYIQGKAGLYDAFQFKKTLRFSPVGFLLGASGVLAMASMTELSADTYSVASQAQLIILAITWAVCFRSRLSSVCWLSLATILGGVIGFNLSGNFDHRQQLGIMLMLARLFCEASACVCGECLMKQVDEEFYIQTIWIKPVEFVCCIILLFAMPGIGEQPRPWKVMMEQGFFHDWNLLTVGIVFAKMGDTMMLTMLVKNFDSIVEGFARAMGMLFPTQLFVQLVAKPKYDTLKITSAGHVLFGVLTYICAARAMERSAERKLAMKVLENKLSVHGSAVQTESWG